MTGQVRRRYSFGRRQGYARRDGGQVLLLQKQPFRLRRFPNAFHDMANRARILISQGPRRN